MDRQTITTYDRIAQEYDNETAHFWEKFPRTFLDRFIELSGVQILDVGSGPGRDGLLLKQAGKDVIGLDASKEMAALSRARGLETVIGDFLAIPFAEHSFDSAWAYTSLLHTPKKKVGVALEEIRRIMRDDGIVGLGFIEGVGEGYRENSGENQPRWFSYYDAGEVRRIAHKHGFEERYFEVFTPGPRQYLNFIFQKL